MAKVSAPHNKAGIKPVKKKINITHPKANKSVYCILCRKSCFALYAQGHVHSLQHHSELDTVLGKDQFHQCEACKASSMSLDEYAEHITTTQHNAKLKSLMYKQMKPVSLYKTLGKETMDRIMERNKTRKKEEKKAVKKKKKKLKQQAGQNRAEMQQGATRKNMAQGASRKNMAQGASKKNMAQGASRKNMAVPKKVQLEKFKQGGSNACSSGEPSVRDQSTQSAQQLGFKDNFSVKVESSQTDRRPHNKTEGGAANKPEQTKWQYDAEFTSDHLPHNGAIIFDHGQNVSAGPSKSGQAGSAHPASTNGSVNGAPVRDVDVSAMLRQIRRALGVREPCRADREARRQSGEVDQSAAQQAGAETGCSIRKNTKEASAAATPVQSSQVNTPASASNASVGHSKTVPPGPKQGSSKTTQGTTKHGEKSSVLASDSNERSNSQERESQGPLDSLTSRSPCLTASSKPSQNTTRKVRIAHRSAKVQGAKEPEPDATTNTWLNSSGAKSKSNLKETSVEMKRKKQEKGKGMPRFGIESANPSLSGKESATQANDKDMTLSEGFHWESLPDCHSGAHRTELPPPNQKTTCNDSRTETQSEYRTQEPSGQRGAAQERCSRPTVETASVKVEANLDDEYGDLGANSSPKKRKRKQNVCDGVSDKVPSGKKKTKPNKDQVQMDQLLAVSLREDELSHSLQDLDKSLIQARSALQAAYAEVQRLLLLRQQITAEVNSLRTQRIEILQGMQGGYTGAEQATASTAGARLSPLPSSSAFPTSLSQQPPPTHPGASISPIALPTMPVKQEILQQSTAGQASQFAKTVSSNSDMLHVPVNLPAPLIPSDLLPSRPLPCLAAPVTAVTSLLQLKTEYATSPNANHLTESPARQQAATLAACESGEGVGATVDPIRGQSVSAAPPDEGVGNDSDASVEMMEPTDQVVINIDESDNEDASNAPVHQEPPPQSVTVEFSSSSTRTSQQNDVQRKVQPTPVKDVSVAPECVDVVEDEEPSVGAFMHHMGPVHGLHVHEGHLYTCSGDNTARAYSLKSRECQAMFEGHTNKINCLLVSSLPNMPARLYTGSSDQTIRCYSIKSTKCLEQISLSDRVLCLHIAWNILYAGLANGSVASYDLKTLKHLDVFECHGPRGVSCLGTAQEGARRVLLVGSYDSTISVRDAKSGLLLRTLEGHTKTVLCMKVVNDLVFSGSSDTSVHAHNIHTGELVRIYKGHGHAVTSIVILGKVMVTACLDKLVRVFELQSHDRLQVYGGHSDMVMCMAVHKSVVYTGCYDGSVQAVRLNLMKNYRCWWQNCSLIFGLVDHLLQHLVRDHTNPNLQAVKCRWRGCGTFFGTQQSVCQMLPEHMRSHADNDSKLQP